LLAFSATCYQSNVTLILASRAWRTAVGVGHVALGVNAPDVE
jgi:hypothetical protein